MHCRKLDIHAGIDYYIKRDFYIKYLKEDKSKEITNEKNNSTVYYRISRFLYHYLIYSLFNAAARAAVIADADTFADAGTYAGTHTDADASI